MASEAVSHKHEARKKLNLPGEILYWSWHHDPLEVGGRDFTRLAPPQPVAHQIT